MKANLYNADGSLAMAVDISEATPIIRVADADSAGAFQIRYYVRDCNWDGASEPITYQNARCSNYMRKHADG